jgi:hypothetical protein
MAPHSEPSASDAVGSGAPASLNEHDKATKAYQEPVPMNRSGEIDLGNFPKPPTFQDKYEERKYQKERLALAFRIFAKLGFDEGVAGHITVRVCTSF